MKTVPITMEIKGIKHELEEFETVDNGILFTLKNGQKYLVDDKGALKSMNV